MSTEIVLAFIVVALVLFMVALLYKSWVDGEVSVLGMKIRLRAGGRRKQEISNAKRPMGRSSEVIIDGEFHRSEIRDVAGTDIRVGSEPITRKPSQPSKSRVVIKGELKDTDVQRVAGNNIVEGLTEEPSLDK